MQAPDDLALLQRRLRGVLLLLSLLVPAFCVFGGLALAVASQQSGGVSYLLLTVWAAVGAAIGLLVWRAQQTVGAIAKAREELPGSNPEEPSMRS